MSRKSIYILLFLFMSAFISSAQNFYFFCINVGENSDGSYIAGKIDDQLKKLGPNGSFIIYIRGGVAFKDGETYDAVVVDKMEDWNNIKGKINKVKRCSVLPEPEVDNMMRRFDRESVYEVKNHCLSKKKNISVFWFADKDYYNNYGEKLLLKFYYSCMGEKTWDKCVLFPDKGDAFANESFQELLKTSFASKENIIINK